MKQSGAREFLDEQDFQTNLENALEKLRVAGVITGKTGVVVGVTSARWGAAQRVSVPPR